MKVWLQSLHFWPKWSNSRGIFDVQGQSQTCLDGWLSVKPTLAHLPVAFRGLGTISACVICENGFLGYFDFFPNGKGSTEGFSGLARSHSVSHKIDQVFGELQQTFCRFLGPLGTPRLRFD